MNATTNPVQRQMLLVALLVPALSILWSGGAAAGTQYNTFEDAAVAQAKAWQSGKKARPMLSSDGMVVFPFGQSMPTLTCSPARACDVEMEPGEKVKQVTLGDKSNWDWNGAESVSKGLTIQHVVFQPRDIEVETNVMIFTDRRTYHIKLRSPKEAGAYLNRVGFYYPEQLVESWESKMGAEATVKAKEEQNNALTTSVPFEKWDFDYRIEGDADFKPVRVMNDGERVIMEMPDSLRTSANPILQLLDDKDNVMKANYRRDEDPDTGKIHFVVYRLFKRAELVIDDQKVRIIWKKKEKSTWKSLFGSSN